MGENCIKSEDVLLEYEKRYTKKLEENQIGMLREIKVSREELDNMAKHISIVYRHNKLLLKYKFPITVSLFIVCGAIREDIGKKTCDCINNRHVKLLKVESKEKLVKKCGICGGMNPNGSIVRRFFLAEDAVSSVLATALYNKIPNKPKISKNYGSKDDIFGDLIEEDKVNKQLLIFSDNRQSAAYFATYLNSSYKDVLIKSILTKVILDNSKICIENGWSLENYHRRVERFAMDKNILHGTIESNKIEIWKWIIGEFISSSPNSLCNMGYLHFSPNFEFEEMRASEHTAQLKTEYAAEVQNKFINGDINVLSCSTTFELGVDVGELETVFMKNMPPTPANYAQRAGRAGRRLDSTAYALTYSRLASHDFSNFTDPYKMISGTIKPPYFEISNTKIAKRHMYACALSAFWKRHSEYFKTVDDFFFKDGIPGPDLFKEFLKEEPDDLYDLIKKIVPEELHLELEIDNWGWVDDLYGEYGVMTKITTELHDDLEANFHIQEAKNVELNRDLQIAISEYAPESQVVANGKLWTSRYVKKVREKDLIRKRFYSCNCGYFNTTLSIEEKNISSCPICGGKIHSGIYMMPEFGFITEASVKDPGNTRPERTYSSRKNFSGHGNIIEEKEFVIGNKTIKLSAKNHGLLTVTNNGKGGGFNICKICGYGTVGEKPASHKNPEGKKCKGIFERVALGYDFETDIVEIEFQNIFDDVSMEEGFWESLMYAIIEGMSSALEIDRSDIDGTLYVKNSHTKSIVLFDTVPGGAGHVKRLLDEKQFINSLTNALEKVSSCSCGGEKQDTSCYNCLRNYYNQYCHDRLKRGYAIKGLETILGRELAEA